MASCVVIFGLLFLALGFIATSVSFCAPYWLYNHNNYEDSGLWGHGYCNAKNALSTNIGASASESGMSFDISQDKCKWRWAWESDWAWEKNKVETPWFVATQGLVGFGVVTLLFVFLIACGNLCCGCGKETVSILLTIGLLLLFGVLLVAAGLIVFGIYAWLEWDASVHSSTYRYNWGFYLGIAGVFLSAISSTLYLIDSCRGRPHSGYERGEVV